MFGWLHRKKDEDFGDIRSQVLNEPYAQDFRNPPIPEPKYNEEDMTPKTRTAFEPFSPSGDNMPSDFSRNDFAPEPFPREPLKDSRMEPSKNYEIMDRLNLIESQLSAVRSMTETINERLKNMESRLGLQRRY